MSFFNTGLLMVLVGGLLAVISGLIWLIVEEVADERCATVVTLGVHIVAELFLFLMIGMERGWFA